jgi:hypothetical protein
MFCVPHSLAGVGLHERCTKVLTFIPRIAPLFATMSSDLSLIRDVYPAFVPQNRCTFTVTQVFLRHFRYSSLYLDFEEKRGNDKEKRTSDFR